jgi:hypothetical protein
LRLQANWYLAIPWVLGTAAWLIARRRGAPRSYIPGVACFLIGCAIVLIVDLANP